MTKKITGIRLKGKRLAWQIDLEFKPQDCWIGVYWQVDDIGLINIWVCLLPCFPVHFQNYLKY